MLAAIIAGMLPGKQFGLIAEVGHTPLCLPQPSSSAGVALPGDVDDDVPSPVFARNECQLAAEVSGSVTWGATTWSSFESVAKTVSALHPSVMHALLDNEVRQQLYVVMSWPNVFV
jgi:hypothetical protein